MNDDIIIKHSKKKRVKHRRRVDSQIWLEMRKQKFLKHMKKLGE